VAIASLFIGCGNSIKEGQIQEKTEEQIAIASKIPGKIAKIFVKEGDFAKKGDTLAILDLPEVDAKIQQAEGAVTSASTIYMAVKATENQIIQLKQKTRSKQQYEFAQSPSKDMATCSKIPWFPANL
jgi:HlyD family secretion protein